MFGRHLGPRRLLYGVGPMGDELRDVYLRDIRFDERQPRREIDADESAALEASMATLGRTVQYITVTPVGEGTYLVLAGERRVRAAMALGWEYLPAVVVDTPREDQERLARQVAENAVRVGLRPWELCAAVDRLRATMAPPVIASATGLSLRSVYNYLSILEHPDLVDALRDGRSLRSVLLDVAARANGDDVAPAPAEPPRWRGLVASVDRLARAWASLTADQRATLADRLRPLLDPEKGDESVTPPSAVQ